MFLYFQVALLFWCAAITISCDLEQLSGNRQVSVEENAQSAKVIIRGFAAPTSELPKVNALRSESTVFFDFISAYKGNDLVHHLHADNNRQINVTFPEASIAACIASGSIPLEYIIFCDIAIDLNAISIVKWDEETDQRVWTAVGWSRWSDWSSCSVSCSGGIQQRIRHCLIENCAGFNVEQRPCNLFGCKRSINLINNTNRGAFHPPKELWERVPGRTVAWRLKPNSYIWIPSSDFFIDSKINRFPKQFVLFVTLKVDANSIGTVFSLRSRNHQDRYLSLEVDGEDLKLVQAAPNGTDLLRIPATLNDGMWHQIAISLRDNSTIECFVDCQWSQTYILKKNALAIPDDSDVIIGYLFSGELEQMTISADYQLGDLQCSSQATPIIDPAIIMNQNV